MDTWFYIAAIPVVVIAIIFVLVISMRKSGNSVGDNIANGTEFAPGSYVGECRAVVISDFGVVDNNKLAIIKCVRTYTGLGLGDAKTAVENRRIESVPIDRAEALVVALNAMGVASELE